jgi:hypothetical protein
VNYRAVARSSLPEGWQVALYDLHKREWIDRGCSSYDTLREARPHAVESAAAIFGKSLAKVELH